MKDEIAPIWILKLRGNGVNINKPVSGHLPAKQIIDVECGSNWEGDHKSKVNSHIWDAI